LAVSFGAKLRQPHAGVLLVETATITGTSSTNHAAGQKINLWLNRNAGVEDHFWPASRLIIDGRSSTPKLTTHDSPHRTSRPDCPKNPKRRAIA